VFLTDLLPAPVRKWIYATLATVSTIEGVLDAADAGLIPERVQGIALGIATALGFGLAFARVTDVKTTTVTVEEDPGDAGHGTLEVILLSAATAVLVFAILVAASDSITF
jgi:hypothetical protein